MTGLGDILVQQGVLTRDQLEQAEAHRRVQGSNLTKALVELRLADEAQLVRAFATSLDMPYTEVDSTAVDPAAALLLDPRVARELTALPVRFGSANDVVVAIADPGARDSVARDLEEVMGLPVSLALAARRPLLEAIEVFAREQEVLTAPVGEGSSAPAGRGTPDTVPAVAAEAVQGVGRPAVPSEQAAEVELDDLLRTLVERGGSDLHLTAGIPPTIRIHGELVALEGYPTLFGEELQKMLYAIMTQKQREQFENDLELDLSYAVKDLARFRVNIFQQRDSIGSVMRVIPFEILPLEELGIPEQVANFAYLPRGFVLVTGPTGSGKSTTLASLIDLANRNRAAHIMTIEDPIEFLHRHKLSVVNQREVGSDTHGFAPALKHVLRQDPDIILVGEMRDLETIQIALTAAETGHLVFGTLHTQDAPQSIDRIIDVFPPHQQEQIRVMLAGALKGVVCQTLIKTADGKGRTVAVEIMVVNSGIKNLIREGKTHQIYSAIQAGAKDGMIAMDQSLALAVKAGRITYDAALEKCNQPAEFNRLAGRA